MPLMRSESWAFIWQPNVVTWYRFKARESYPRGRNCESPPEPGWWGATAERDNAPQPPPPPETFGARLALKEGAGTRGLGYLANSTERDSRMTVTLIWPGYSSSASMSRAIS